MRQLQIGRRANTRPIYAEIERPADPARLFENARRISTSLRPSGALLDHLFANSVCTRMNRAEWENEFLTSMAVDLLLRDFFRPVPLMKLGQYLDHAAAAETFAQLSSARGMVLVAFHGSFVVLVRKLFEQVNGGFMVQTGGQDAPSPQSDSRGVLFVAMRALQEGRHVYLAPDGPYGSRNYSVGVFGIQRKVGEGAPFLAFHTGCETGWWSVARCDERFSPIVEPGPRRQEGENYDRFRDRFFRFYASKIEAVLTGDPQNLALSEGWISRLERMIAVKARRSRPGVI